MDVERVTQRHSVIDHPRDGNGSLHRGKVLATLVGVELNGT